MQEQRRLSLVEQAGPDSADGKASGDNSVQKTQSDSGLITLGKRLAPQKKVGTGKIPNKRAKREVDDLILTNGPAQLPGSNATTSNQVEEVKQADDQ